MLDKQKNKGEPKPYLRNINVRWFDFDLSDVLEMRFEDHEIDRYQARRGDLIICEGGYPGRAAIWRTDEPIYLQKALHRVRFHEPERAKWVLYWLYLKDLEGSLSTAFSGTGIQHFTKAALARFQIPLPPLDEQKRIVAVLDQAFAAFDRARANAQANLADAAELFENSLTNIFISLSSRIGVTPLAKAVHPDCTLSYGIVQPGNETTSGVPVVRPVDLKQRHITSKGMKKIAPERASGYARTKLHGGELLLCVRGSVGEIAVASYELADANVTRGIVPIRFVKEEVLPEFGYFQLRSQYARAQLLAKTYGAALTQINIKDLRTLQFLLPDLQTQKEIVGNIEHVYQRSEQLKTHYTAKLQSLAQLRKSLLQRAFAGELT